MADEPDASGPDAQEEEEAQQQQQLLIISEQTEVAAGTMYIIEPGTRVVPAPSASGLTVSPHAPQDLGGRVHMHELPSSITRATSLGSPAVSRLSDDVDPRSREVNAIGCDVVISAYDCESREGRGGRV